jgi:MarR family transcriptional regulator, organic hydroperoxide resistance regulator
VNKPKTRGSTTAATRRIRPLAKPAMFPITDFPIHYFAAIQRQNQVNLGHALRPVGISPHVWRVLATLSDGDGRTIGYIAEATVIDRSNLGRLLEGMAREGLVERMTAPDDRRVSLTRLSAKGMARYGAALPIVLAMYQRLLADVKPEHFATLMETLRRMKRNALVLAETSWGR